jgi:hypothetical protein
LLVLVLAVAAFLAFTGCAGNRNQPSQGWAGVAVEDGRLFLGTKDGRIVELLSSDTGRPPSIGREFRLEGTEEGDDSARVPPAFYATPALSDGRLYVGSYQGFVYSMTSEPTDNRDSLADVGVFEIDGNNLAKSIAGAVVVSGDAVVVAATEDADQGRLYVLDRTRLDEDRPAERCRYPAKGMAPVGQIWSTPLVIDGIIYFGDLAHNVHAVSTVDCSLLWEAPADVEGAIMATPIMVQGTLYFGSFDRAFYSADPQTGAVTQLFQGEDWFWASPASDGNLIYAPNIDGKLYAYDIGRGSVAWIYDQEGDTQPMLSPPAIVDNSIVIASDRGIVTLLDTNGSRLDDSGSGADRVRAPITVVGNMVYVHWVDEVVTAYEVNRGNLDKVWELDKEDLGF